MPWYYAGPDAKPVGPIALEELHARRGNGTISPETYVIEYVGQPDDTRTWRRYREVFPASPSALAAPLPPPPPVVASVPTAQPHPLFPSAAPIPSQGRALAPTPGYVPFVPTEKTNQWCSWGFGLSLAGLILLLPSCGLTVFLAIPALIISIIGFLKVQKDRTQSGRGLALTGVGISGVTLLIALIVLAIAIPTLLKERGLTTTTEQSTTDSQ